MKRILAGIALFTFTSVSTSLPASGELFVFPKNGQTKEQQEQDEFTCYKWAKDQTGFDPNKAVEHTAAPAPQGGAGKGAAKGAAVGAGVGAAAGAHKKRKGEKQQEAAEQQAEKQQAANVEGYQRAFGACM